MSINAKSDWFSFLVSDAAICHAILSLASLNRDLVRGDAVSRSTLYHRVRAIRHVRRRLGDIEDRNTREVLAGTVAILAMADASQRLCHDEPITALTIYSVSKTMH
jgi:hypothetical protein